MEFPIELTPRGRNKRDKDAYLFLRWYYRLHRQEIEKEIKNTILNFLLTGQMLYENQWNSEVKNEKK